jgi:uncharacterized protein YgiM (DUF1202 family)
MKTVILFLAILFSLTVEGQVHVKGYTKTNGTYVAPHTRSSPNSSPYDNYSYPGNTNPYTGKTATGNPDTYINNLYNNNSTPSTSDVWVDGYYKSDGTYVTGHYRSAPNGNPYDNFSFPGNTNPYTGKTATGNPDPYLKNLYGNSSSIYGTTYYVSSNSLNVRSGPSTNYSLLTSLTYGDDVQVLETTNSSWTKVMVNLTVGYVYSSYLSFSNPSYSTTDYFTTPSTTYSNDFNTSYSNSSSSYTTTNYVNTSTLNVRSGASTSHSVLTSLSYGDQVEVVSIANANWTKVKVSYFDGYSYKTTTGYVYSDYITSNNPLFSNSNYSSYSSTNDAYEKLLNNYKSTPNYNSTYSSSNSYSPYGYNNGKIAIWTDCSDDGKIFVYIDGVYKGQLTTYFYDNSAPECTDSGILGITLAKGTYKITAKGNKKSWEGYVTVETDDCSTQQLNK